MLAKPGKVVKLITGGPAMTVDEQWSGGTCRCVWFDENNKLHSGTFNEVDLIETAPDIRK